jgi:hypothetical protein
MRSILLASAAILIASSAPSMARDYPWCARTITNPDFGDCSFTSFRQCMAARRGTATAGTIAGNGCSDFEPPAADQSVSIAPTSASATVTPSTLASP